MKLKKGNTVRVIGERGTSKVWAILSDVNGVLLEAQIGGRRTWSLDDLRLVKRSPANVKSIKNKKK